MKKSLLFMLFAYIGITIAHADVINIQGIDYQIDVLIDRDLGPGVNYKRLRIPDFPLNVNMITMDLNNPYNRIETTQGGEQLGKTEKLVDAYHRQYTAEKRPLAGANGNFWCVSNQYHWAEFLVGATFNGNVRNGQIITETNAHADWWGHNNGSPGCVAITPTKEMVIDFMYYKGWVKSEKFEPLVIQQTNKVVRDGEVGLYNSFFGRTKSFIPADQYTGDDGVQHMRRVENVSTEVYLTINEGHTWMVGRPMQCTVKEVKTNAGASTLGDYDVCLVGRGANKDALASLVPGDVITIELGWEQPDGSVPEIEQLIGGNGVVMVDGVLTNLNDIDDYNTKTYSRCAYGTTADRKTMINVVIDMSTDLVYGKSAGCNTKVMCDIMRYYGCTNIMNMDAGGSAQMMVNGKIVNRTTEGTPRAVANGWFFYSIAPQDDVIARLAFDEVTLTAPPYSSYTPKILGYNQYGDLIDEDVQGFTLSCDANVGTCNGDIFIAAGNPGVGNLTATLNGVSVTKQITIADAAMAIRIKPLLIDATREYAMEVTATIGENIYTYDPAHIAWTVEDNSIVSIDENGILKGLKEGTTTVTGKIGDFEDVTTVTVEIADAPKMYPLDFNVWTAKGPSGISNATLAQDGTISFTYGSPRSAYVQITDTLDYYSLPDKLWMSFTPSVALTKLEIDMRSPSITRTNLIEVTPSSGEVFAAGETHTIEIPISSLGDPADLILYPISVYNIKFNIQKSTDYKGAQTIKINDFYAEYENYVSSVESIIVDKDSKVSVYPNPAVEDFVIVTAATTIKAVKIYSMAGTEVKSQNCDAACVEINVDNLTAGIYILAVETQNSSTTSKLIVK